MSSQHQLKVYQTRLLTITVNLLSLPTHLFSVNCFFFQGHFILFFSCFNVSYQLDTAVVWTDILFTALLSQPMFFCVPRIIRARTQDIFVTALLCRFARLLYAHAHLPTHRHTQLNARTQHIFAFSLPICHFPSINSRTHQMHAKYSFGWSLSNHVVWKDPSRENGT